MGGKESRGLHYTIDYPLNPKVRKAASSGKLSN